jgi:hypothetical protein
MRLEFSVMSPLRPFTEHPASLGESYLEHLGTALGFGSRMVLAGLACLMHGLLPFLFERTGSRVVTELHEQMIARRRGTRAPTGVDTRIPL